MKTTAVALTLTFFLAVAAMAQVASPGAAPVDSTEIPPEKWDGEIGEDGKIPELGKYIDYEDGQVNFRVWDNKTRVYFLDENDVVIEPPFDLVTAQLRIRGGDDEFIRMANRGMYLEGREFIRPPWIFHTVLRLQSSKGDRRDEVFTFMFSQDYIRPEGESD